VRAADDLALLVQEAIRSSPAMERVIFASGQLVCRLGYIPKDDYDYQPSTLYGLSKAISERIVKTADDIGATWTIVRLTSLWGPWFDVPSKNLFMAIARNLYMHPGGATALKQWGYISNAVFQIWKLIQAPAEMAHKNICYLADHEPVELRVFADKVQAALGVRPIRMIPAGVLKTVAFAGDVVKMLGWGAPPLTSFRYQNMVTPEIQNLGALEQVVGPLPYTVDQGIDITVQWLREQQRM
jgi:nucleoside-diphosphate-sugar epimerase